MKRRIILFLVIIIMITTLSGCDVLNNMQLEGNLFDNLENSTEEKGEENKQNYCVHDVTEWENENKEDCEAGEYVRFCKKCNMRFSMPGKHEFQNKLSYDGNSHYYVCNLCGKHENISKHVFKECICEVCDYAIPETNGVQYLISDDGSFAIVGNANKELTEIIVLDTYNGVPVTTIGEGAFSNCTNLVSISLPDSIKTIKENSFAMCTSLESIIIPNGVEIINLSTFDGCTALKNVFIPDSVIVIGRCAFYGCTSLEKIAIPDSVTTISGLAFYNCSSLGEVVYHENSKLNYIGEYAFAHSSILNPTIPNSVERFYHGVYDLVIAYIYENGYYIGNETNPFLILLNVQKGYDSYNIHPDTKIIAPGVFKNCSELKEITIPDSVVTIENNAFLSCSSLTKVSFSENSKLKTIAYSAFEKCSSLSEINISNSIELIGSNAFANCSPDLFNVYDNGNYLGNEENPYLVLYKSKSYDISSIIIHENTCVIADCALTACEQLTNIFIPKNIRTIGWSSFNYCPSLSKITLEQQDTDWISTDFYHRNLPIIISLEELQDPSSILITSLKTNYWIRVNQ